MATYNKNTRGKGRDKEAAPSHSGSGFGQTYDGRANTNAGTTDSPLKSRDPVARVVKWNKNTA